MGATPTQVQAVVDLGIDSADGINAVEAAAFNDAYGNVGAPNFDFGNTYQSEPNDPYEKHAADRKLIEPVTIYFAGAATDISTDGGTSDCSAQIGQWDGNLSVSNKTYYVVDTNNTGATINQSGLLTASGAVGGDGDIIVGCRANLDTSVFCEETINITGQV